MDSLGNKNWSGAGFSKELMDKGGVRGHCNQVGWIQVLRGVMSRYRWSVLGGVRR